MFKNYDLLQQSYTKDGQKLVDTIGKVQDAELRSDLYSLLEIFIHDFHDINEYMRKEIKKYYIPK